MARKIDTVWGNQIDFLKNMVEGSSFLWGRLLHVSDSFFFPTGGERRNSERIYAWPCWPCPVGTVKASCVSQSKLEKGLLSHLCLDTSEVPDTSVPVFLVPNPARGTNMAASLLLTEGRGVGRVKSLARAGLLHTGNIPSCEGEIMLSLAKYDQVMRWWGFLSLSPGARANPR